MYKKKGYKDGLCTAVPFQFAHCSPFLVSGLLLVPIKMCGEQDVGRTAKIHEHRLWVKLRDMYRSSLNYWSRGYDM